MRLLIATDGSASADRTIDVVLHQAWGEPLTVRVVTVLDLAAMSVGASWPVVPVSAAGEMEEQARAAANATLASAAERLRGHAAVESELLEGRPGPVIAADGARWGADLILIGNRGHGALASMLLGSVSAEAVDLSERPVLVVRDDRLERVVVGVDGSPWATHAVDTIRRWSFVRSLPIQVVTVGPSPYPWWIGMADAGGASIVPDHAATMGLLREDEARFTKDAMDLLAAGGCRSTSEVREGDAADQLIAAGGTTGSVIVVGTHGRTGLTRLVMGSIARKVLLHAPCSVLIVHRPAADGSMAGSA